MLKLEDREWKEFKIEDIVDTFKIAKSIDYGKTTYGNNVFIGRKTSDNGIQGFVKNETVENGNCITIGMVGVPTAYWQTTSFVASQNILVIRNTQFNQYNAIFLCGLLNKNILTKYNYGKPLNLKHFPKQIIKLPTTFNGEPDYEFMEEYIKEREEQKLEEYVSFARKKIEKIEKETVETNTNHKWKEFYLRDLFEIYHGKRLVKEKRKDGETPLLTASAVNEGVSDFIEDTSMKKYKNVITVDMFGHSFYHKYECCGDDNIYFFVNDELDDEVKQFISVCINRNSNKYSYGKQFREKNALNERVLLPVDESGTLDVVYMKQYIYIYIQDVDVLFELPECKLSDREWKEFKLQDLFQFVQSFGDNQAAKLSEGQIPLISAGSTNNGICKCIKNFDIKSQLFQGNTITIDMFGKVYYHPYDFRSVSHGRVNILISKFKLNQYIGHFFCSTIEISMKDKYSYSKMCTQKRLNIQKVKLPIDKFHEPDYNFMEIYIKNQKLQKLNTYIKFLTK